MVSYNNIILKAGERELNEREKEILSTIVQLYILKATPVGSRFLSKYLESHKKFSPATLRNVMSELEEMDFISHPHTSAGRIPTDKGYRFYVDAIKQFDRLTEKDRTTVKSNLTASDSEVVIREASKLLGLLSKYLSVVTVPHIGDMIVLKIELIQLSSTKLLVVIALNSNIVRTVTLETEFSIDSKYLDDTTSYINERISGKPLNFLRNNFKELIKDIEPGTTPLVRLFIDSVDKIFSNYNEKDRLVISGTQNLLEHPEFEDLSKVRSIIELIESEDIIIHLLDKFEDTESGIKVLIGKELNENTLEDYSVVLSSYTFGSSSGTVGLIGPKRMNYPYVISLLEYVTKVMSETVYEQ